MNRKTRMARSRKHRVALTMRVERLAFHIVQQVKSRMRLVTASTTIAGEVMTRLGEVCIEITVPMDDLTKKINDFYINGPGKLKPKGFMS